ncbi:YppG-like protein [Evansella caseinilytica]|uniref:YppG-like protein n=1 Tax=Evansella caseinilytica TaxID=1503961 RepID=A0A1H3PQC3_9BACI|nr:YppG family protein [Evansella caseinilytica]SDZ03404.1 YppG-like protein [Evansella caseinilytica]
MRQPHRPMMQEHPGPADRFSQMLFGPPGQQHNYYQPPHQAMHPPNQANYYHQYQQQYQYPNPSQGHPAQQQPPAKGNKKILQYFMKEDGTWDYEKIGSSVQQVSGIAGQFSPLVKQLSPLLAFFKK